MKDPFASVENLTELVTSYMNRPSQPESIPDAPATPPTGNPAIDDCCRAYELAWATAKDRGAGRDAAQNEAEQAFRRAMPTLTNVENIRDFIACVAHGVLLDAISGPNAARLLYAAQVANSASKSLLNSFRVPPGFFLQRLDTPDAPLSPLERAYYTNATPHPDSQSTA